MRYCPNLTCPHRLRVDSPAEFFDRVHRCSDCRGPLVLSEEDAIAGRTPPTAVPYRVRAEVPDERPASRPRPAGDQALGAGMVAMGIGASALAYGLASHGSGGIHMLAWGAVAVGLFRMLARKA